MTLTKAIITEKIQKDLGVSKADSANLVETALKLIKAARTCSYPDLGSFV